MTDADEEFWFNVQTRTVEQGRHSSWEQRLGPYPTREAAARAIEDAHGRTEAWDVADEKWSQD
jgi:hypothetical protein